MTQAFARQLHNADVVANLWVYAGEDGYVARIAGKVYVLDGTDAKKLALLRQLAATDFLSAEWVPVPENFGVISPRGERLRYAQLSMLSDEYSKSVLVGPLLEKLASSIPKQMRQVGDDYEPFVMRMPETPLTVFTVVVEHVDGRLVPVVND